MKTVTFLACLIFLFESAASAGENGKENFKWNASFNETNSDECNPRQKSCIRMCSYEPWEGEIFDFKKLEAHWCSHIIIRSAEVLNCGGIRVNSTIRKNIQAFHEWNVKNKPLLILSFGEKVDEELWKNAIGDPEIRNETIESIQRAFVKYKFDGIEISWQIPNYYENGINSNNLTQFLAELRQALPGKQFIATFTPQTSYTFHRYAKNIAELVDYILLQNYKFHHANDFFAGHHSPLFPSPQQLTDARMTTEEYSFDWIRAIPASKLIIGFSAEGIWSVFHSKEYREIGSATSIFKKKLEHKIRDPISQNEICKILQNNETIEYFLEEIGAPYAILNDEFFAYDNTKSMQIKTIWASLNNFGGIGLHAINMDNVKGECPENQPFPLLKTIVKAQVCEYCIHRNKTMKKIKETEKQKCDTPEFQVSCNYYLSHYTNASETLPFGQCTEIVIEGVKLTGDGKVEFLQKYFDENLKYMVKWNSEDRKIPLILSFQCQMEKSKFVDILNNSTIFKIDAIIKKYELNGVEIKCDEYVSPENKELYSKFLKDLKTTLNQGLNSGHSLITMSVKLPVYRIHLNETYDINLLNTLHHISLEPFQNTYNKSYPILSPLFSDPTQKDQFNIDRTITHLVNQGLKRNTLLLPISGYGIQQKVFKNFQTRNQAAAFGNELNIKQNITQKITQSDICKKLYGNSIQTKFIYDYIAAYSNFTTPTTNEWISYETDETIKYKIKYAIREGLAGIGFISINDDDDEYVCNQGDYPLLYTINRNIRFSK